MPTAVPDLRDTIFAAWKTNNQVTIFLVEHLPVELWEAAVPGSPRRTIRMICAHLHNARRAWIRTLGTEFGIVAPGSVDRYKVTPKQLVAALGRSGAGILKLLQFGCERGGTIPAARAYVWRNLPLDVGHVLSYFVAHEAHHRGQIIMLARQLGHRLPVAVTGGVWEWSKRSREG
ncbi:MAG TPA: DinB family protein [Candidatus Acidoferrales bacterium]